MPEDYKVAETKRSTNNISDQRKFLGVVEAETLQKIRNELNKLATVEKFKTVVIQQTDMQDYQTNKVKPNYSDKFRSCRDRNKNSYCDRSISGRRG